MNNPMNQMPTMPGRRQKPRGMGCLITMLIIVLVVGGLGYFFVYKPVSQVAKGFSNLEAFTTLDQNVRVTTPYTPPASGDLTTDQVNRYMGVIEAVQTEAMARIQALEGTFGNVDFDNLSPMEAYRTVMGAYREILDHAIGVKEQQVQALNQNGFSLAEYNWVKEQVASAAGFSSAELSLNSLLSGELGGKEVQRSGNATNRELVQPHLQELGSWAPLLMFGL